MSSFNGEADLNHALLLWGVGFIPMSPPNSNEPGVAMTLVGRIRGTQKEKSQTVVMTAQAARVLIQDLKAALHKAQHGEDAIGMFTEVGDR